MGACVLADLPYTYVFNHLPYRVVVPRTESTEETPGTSGVVRRSWLEHDVYSDEGSIGR